MTPDQRYQLEQSFIAKAKKHFHIKHPLIRVHGEEGNLRVDVFNQCTMKIGRVIDERVLKHVGVLPLGN